MSTASEIIFLSAFVPLVAVFVYLVIKKYRDNKNYKIELSLDEWIVESNYNDLQEDYLTMIRFLKLVDEKDREIKTKIK